MKIMHVVNALAWLTNGVVWAGYTHNTGMAVLSLACCTLACLMWALEPN